jgi:hypothetical protein
MPSKGRQAHKIEALFLSQETAHVRDIYQALYGDPEDRTDRELSQAIGPALTRFFKSTGGNVKPTGKPYTYQLVY